MMDLALQIVTVIACAIVVFRVEPALNKMTGGTLMIVRLSFYQLAVGAGAELLAILAFGYVPGLREMVMACGIATLLLCERRIRLLSRSCARRTP